MPRERLNGDYKRVNLPVPWNSETGRREQRCRRSVAHVVCAEDAGDVRVLTVVSGQPGGDVRGHDHRVWVHTARSEVPRLERRKRRRARPDRVRREAARRAPAVLEVHLHDAVVVPARREHHGPLHPVERGQVGVHRQLRRGELRRRPRRLVVVHEREAPDVGHRPQLRRDVVVEQRLLRRRVERARARVERVLELAFAPLALPLLPRAHPVHNSH
mmetsp:Transcript_21627/g.67134  ORF Transcript_21627/g.67134 Transcript_21627/m.67134 type:complete len:216 (-) Transcript_21627:727-1374(-)